MYEYEEFLYGDIPLINFYSVQKLIRDFSSLEVVVVEIPKNASDFEHFPPIFDYPKDCSIKIFEKRIDWDHVRRSPLFFWHAPRDLDQFEKEEKEQKNSAFQKQMFMKGEYLGLFGMKKQILQNVASKGTFKRPRALIYNTALKFNEERQ